MSGDVDTYYGNAQINCKLTGILRACGIYKFKIIYNGDDSVIFTDVPVDKAAFIAVAKTYNMESKVKPSNTNIQN